MNSTADASTDGNFNGNGKTPLPGFTIDYFTEEQIASTSMRDLYISRCKQLEQTPSVHVVKQLPASPEDIDELSSLDLRATYLGHKGVQTLFPIIAACHRLVHLNLTNIGLDAATMIPLLAILKKHNGIREVVLSKNKIGTDGVLKLCHIAYTRGLVYRVELDDAWVVEPLRNRLQKICDKNSNDRDRYPLPARRYEQKPAFDLIDDVPEMPPDIAPEDVELLPAVADAVAQLRAVILRHRDRMLDFQAMFRALVPGVCSAPSFMKVVKLLNITAVDDVFRIHDLSDAFGATVFVEERENDGNEQMGEENQKPRAGRGERVVKFGKIVAGLRDHAFVRASSSSSEQHQQQEEGEEGQAAKYFEAPSTELRDLLDEIFDARSSILESCEMIDVDSTGSLCFDDFVVGIAAATQSNRNKTEKLLNFWLDVVLNDGQEGATRYQSSTAEVEGEETDENQQKQQSSLSPSRALMSVPFKAMLNSLELRGNQRLPASGDEQEWKKWTPRMLRAL